MSLPTDQNLPVLKAATNSFVTLEGAGDRAVVHKFSRAGFRRDFADRMFGRLQAYAGQLQAGSITTPALLDAGLYEQSGFFHLGQTVSFVPGINMDDLRGQALITGVAALLQATAQLRSSASEPDELAVPMDGAFQNFIINTDTHGRPERFVMVDTIPPLARDPDGRFPLEAVQFSDVGPRPEVVPLFLGRKSWRACDLVRRMVQPHREATEIIAPSVHDRAAKLENWLYDHTRGFAAASQREIRELTRDGVSGFSDMVDRRYVSPVTKAQSENKPGYPTSIAGFFDEPPSRSNRVR